MILFRLIIKILMIEDLSLISKFPGLFYNGEKILTVNRAYLDTWVSAIHIVHITRELISFTNIN